MLPKTLSKRHDRRSPMSDFWTAWFPGGSSLTIADFLAFAAVLGAMAFVARRVGPARGADDFALAGRAVPWPVAGLALVAAEVSALTVLGVPSTAFHEDWTYLQFFLGAAAARALVALFFAPAFARAGGATPYAYLGKAFGPRTRAAGAGAFAVSRLASSAVRLLAMSAAAGALVGWGPAPALVLLTAYSVWTLARGGARAAAWTGAFQALVVLGVGALCVLFVLRRVDGGLGGAWSLAEAAGKLRVFDGGPAPWSPGFLARAIGEPPVFWVAALTGFCGSAAAFGADHELAQKLMVVRDGRDARRATALSIAGSFAALAVYLSLGTLLFVFYKQNPGMALPETAERVLPHFAATAMPRILRGLVLAALVMASIDAPLSSLASALTTDLPGPWRRAKPETAAYGVAAALAVLAAVFASSPTALSVAFKLGAALTGPLLGVFAAALAGADGGDAVGVGALVVGAALDLLLLGFGESGRLPFTWTWLLPLGALVSFAFARVKVPRRAARRPAR